MKKFLIIPFLAMVFLTACNDAKFDRYPGTKLDSIPREFRGAFRDTDKKSKKTELIIVEKNYFSMSSTDHRNYLSDSTVMSTYKGAYYLSFLGGNKKYWQVSYIKTSGKNLLIYPLMYDEKLPNEKNSITKYFSPKMGTDSSYYFTMDEEKLLEYTQKKLMKGNAVKLRRIKGFKDKYE
jgi:hypothetical protein